MIDPHSDFLQSYEPESAGDIEIKLIGQTARRGKVQWVAPDGIDLAIVSVALPAMTIEAADCSRMDPLQIGERVFAIGNPFGFGWTQTPGEISQLRVQKKAARLVELVQTSAAINQGNSGGGLYDHDGKLIGITTWSSDKRVAEGISFAIALTTLRLEPRLPHFVGFQEEGLGTMSSLRLRRLQADYERLKQILAAHPRIKLTGADGDPPERYELEYRVRGMRQRGDEITPTDRHKVEIVLPVDYPRLPPQCRMLTPVFHPNIAPHAICVGDHWNAGEPIWSIVSRIAEMIAFQSYNVKSPLNGEAARWVEQNVDKLPTDDASFLLSAPSASGRSDKPQAQARPAAAIRRENPTSPPLAAVAEPRLIICPSCQGKLRVPNGRPPRVRCGRCQTVIDLAAETEN